MVSFSRLLIFLITHKYIKVQKVPETARCIYESMVNRRFCKAFQVLKKNTSQYAACSTIAKESKTLVFLITISS